MEFGDYIGATCQNLHVWKGAVAGADQIVGWPPSFLHSWQAARRVFEVAGTSCSTAAGGDGHWSVPESGWYNCNSDAARLSVVQCTCIAGLVCDPAGHWLQGLSSFTRCVLEPRLAKAFAVREALSWLRRKEDASHFRNVRFKWVRREANEVAHHFASMTPSYNRLQEWGSPPFSLTSFLSANGVNMATAKIGRTSSV
ncbi:hypothetical protein GOBAR_DD06125 [Gossypium barbadense]|nr:hypothetical protein GOBAR_DD06125 [Gossypium barbadense]